MGEPGFGFLHKNLVQFHKFLSDRYLMPNKLPSQKTFKILSQLVSASMLLCFINFSFLPQAAANDQACRNISVSSSAVNASSGSGVWSGSGEIYGPKGTLNQEATRIASFTASGATPFNATIEGPGNLKWNGQTAYGRDVLNSPTASSVLDVFNDGTSGSSIVRVNFRNSDGTTCTYAKTIYFYGAVTSLIATQGLYVADAAGGTWGCGASSCSSNSIATTPAATISARDANGVPVPYLTLVATSSSTSDFSSSVSVSQSSAVAGTYFSNVNVVAKGVSGKTANYSWASGDVKTNSVTYSLGTQMSSVAFTVDAAPYRGQLGTMAVALKDVSGNKPFDAVYTLDLKSNLSLTGSIAPASSTTISQSGSTTNYMILNGAGSWDFFNPIVEGDVSLSGSTFGGKAITSSWRVDSARATASANAAAEAAEAAEAATDAANVASEAADAATVAAQDAIEAIAALSSQVSTLVAALGKQIRSLTNLVTKIRKKVRA